MKKINLVMIVKNEESKIEKCILSAKDIINEIIIVDTGSQDRTKEIALKLGAKVYDYKWNNNFSDARNYGIEKSDADYNLILDADEYIVNYDIVSIKKIINCNKKNIGQIKRINLFEQDGEIRKTTHYISRLAPKGVYFEGSIHEQLDLSIPRKEICIEVEHDGYLNENKFERNISLILKELKLDENNVYMNYQAGKTYYTNKMYDKADFYFEKFYKIMDINNDLFSKEGIVLYLYNIIKLKKFEYGLYVIDEVFDKLNDYCDFYFVCGVFFTELISYDISKYINYFENIEFAYLNALQVGENSSSTESVAGTGSYLAAYNLGIFYELKGDIGRALKYYKLSNKYGYSKANQRITLLE